MADAILAYLAFVVPVVLLLILDELKKIRKSLNKEEGNG